MKTRLLLFLIILTGTTIHAQTIFAKIGPSFSKLTWANSMLKEDGFKKGLVGFDALLGVNYLNFIYFHLSSGLGFIQKGGKEEGVVTDIVGRPVGNIEQVEKLNYLTVNTTFNFKVPVAKFLEPYLSAGPRLDYLISYNENVPFLKLFEDTGELNKVSYGFLLGCGINSKIRKFRMGIAFDYYININKISNFTSEYGYTNKIYDNTYTLDVLIGYAF